MRGLICFICFVICCRVFGFNQPEIIEDLLDSRNGFVWRNFEEEGNIRYIVLHYTFSQTYDLSKNIYLARGVSPNFTVDYDGSIYKNAPNRGMAFHAGISAFNDDVDLNRFSVGIEQVNPACVLEGGEYEDEPWNTAGRSKWDGDDKTLWFEFSQEQYEATGKLARALQLQHKIHGRFVVGHADIAPGRKVDPGPMFPYRLIFEKFNAGYYPSFDKVEKYKTLLSSLKNEDFLGLLSIYGYVFDLPTRYRSYNYQPIFEKKMNAYKAEIAVYRENQKEKPAPIKPKMPIIPPQEGYEVSVLDSFRLHFCSDAKTLEQLSSFGSVSKLGSEELSDLEKVVILALIIGYYNYDDKDLGYDEVFRESLQSFVQDPVRKERTKELDRLLKI